MLRHGNMNKFTIISAFVGLILLSACGDSFFSSDAAYASSLIGVAPPNSVRGISSVRSGTNAPLVRWFMSREDFERYKQALSALGFYTWKKIHYDASEPSSFLDKVLFAGFPYGSDATAVVGEKIKESGKSSVHVYYDYLTREFIAIKGYGNSRIPTD